MIGRRHPSTERWTHGLAVAALWCCFAASSHGQEALEGIADEATGAELMTGGELRTDSDVDALLNEARRYLETDQTREALVLLDHVADLEGMEHVLTSADGVVYAPVHRMIQRLIASMPAEARRQYQLSADGVTRMIMGGPALDCRDEQALRRVVQRYFVSNPGDEAAFALARLLIDRGDYVEARRLLRMALDHPDRSIDADAVRLRLALCELKLGFADGARNTLAGVDAAARDAAAYRMLLDRIEAGELDSEHAADTADWPTMWGADRRDGQMPSLGPAGLNGRVATRWIVQWSHHTPLSAVADDPQFRTLYRGNFRPASRSDVVARWVDKAWQPADELVFGSGRAYVRSEAGVTCVDMTDGSVLWQADAPPKQTSVPTARWRIYGSSDQATPIRPLEVALFGDRASRSMALVDDTLLLVDGHYWPANFTRGATIIVRGRRLQVNPSNELVAYDVEAGKGLWRALLRRPGATGPVTGSRIGAAPVACGGRIITCYEEDGESWLAALDRKTGKIIWQRFLCSGPRGYAPEWAPVGLTVVGEHVYVVTGRGVVVAVDGLDGQVQWARRYVRMDADWSSRRTAGVPRWPSEAMAWRESAAFIDQGRLIVLAADTQQVLTLDPDTGEAVAEPAGDVEGDYVLGFRDGQLVTGGEGAVRMYGDDETRWRMRWQAPTPHATGRAVWAGEAVFVPAHDQVVRIDVATGKRESALAVDKQFAEPIGNLYSDGERLIALGMGTIAGMVDGRREVERLADAADLGDPRALLTRADLLRRLGRLDEAAEHLRRLVELAEGADHRRIAERLLLATLLEQAHREPARASGALAEASGLARSPVERLQVSMARADQWARTDRPAEAAALYARVIASGDQAMLPRNEAGRPRWVHVAAEARVRLDRLVREQSPKVAAALERFAEQRLEQIADGTLPGGDPATALLRLVHAAPGTPAAAEAARRLIGRRDDPAWFERSEMVLRDLARDPSEANRAAAVALRAATFEVMNWPDAAAEQWQRLRDEFGQVELTQAGQTVLAEQLAGKALGRLGAVVTVEQADQMPAPPWRELWSAPTKGTRIVLAEDGSTTDSPFFRDHALFFSPGWNRLARRRLSDFRAAGGWMNLPEELFSALATAGVGPSRVRGGFDGHLLLARGRDHVGAIATVSGEILWSQPAGPALPDNTRSLSRPERIDHVRFVSDGLFVERTWNSDHLVDEIVATDTWTGQTLWRHQTPSHNVDGLWVAAGKVWVLTNDRRVLWQCERLTGRVERQIELDAMTNPGHACWTSQAVAYIGPDRRVRIQRYDRDEPTIIDEAMAMPRRVVLLHDESLAVLGLDSSLARVDTRSGKRMWQVDRNSGIGQSGVDAALSPDGSELYYNARSQTGRERGVAIIDSATGKLKQWIAMGRLTTQETPAATLAAAGEWMPWLERDRSNSRLTTVHVFRKSTGEKYTEHALPTGLSDNRINRIMVPPIVHHGVLLLVTQEQILAIGSEAAGRGASAPQMSDEAMRPDESVTPEVSFHAPDAAADRSNP